MLICSSSTCVKSPTVTVPQQITPGKAVVVITGDTFDSLILERDTTAVVEFYGGSCGTCISMAWIIDSLAVRRGHEALVGAVDTDTEFDLTDRYPVAIPSYLFFCNGELITQVHFSEGNGAVLDSLTATLDRILAAPDAGLTARQPRTWNSL